MTRLMTRADNSVLQYLGGAIGRYGTARAGATPQSDPGNHWKIEFTDNFVSAQLCTFQAPVVAAVASQLEIMRSVLDEPATTCAAEADFLLMLTQSPASQVSSGLLKERK